MRLTLINYATGPLDEPRDIVVNICTGEGLQNWSLSRGIV